RYCQTGRDFDARLAELGAQRVHARVDCDVDYEDAAEAWMDGALQAVAAYAQPAPQGQPHATQGRGTVGACPGASSDRQAARHDRKTPFAAEVLESLVLTGRGSAKETRHVELSLEDSGLRSEPGDALVILAQNEPGYVAELIGV